jgi:hypothetical protein
MMRIDVAFLLGPGSGQNTHGKFYIAVLDHRAPITANGPNSSNSRGQVRTLQNLSKVRDKVREKTRGEYLETDGSDISAAAVRQVVDEIRQAIPALKGQNYTFGRGYIDFPRVADPSGPQPVQKASPKPRRSKKTVHVWI